MFGFIGDLLGLNSGDPAIAAANRNRTSLGKFQDDATGLIDAGSNAASGYLERARDAYGNFTNKAASGSTMLDNALGLNGADGTAAATSAFTAAPGYQYTVDQTNKALGRVNSSLGSYQSGDTIADISANTAGLASQGYNDWLDRLTDYKNYELAGIGGQAGALGDLASLSTGTAGQKVGILDTVTSGLLGANNQQAEGESANKAGLSNLAGKAAGFLTGWF